MSSADIASVVIGCPACGTRYQLPYGALGAGGRDVQCAQCGKSWHATADAPPPTVLALVPAVDEDTLDAAFEAEAAAAVPSAPGAQRDPAYERTLEEIRAAIGPKAKPPADPLDPALLRKSKAEFNQRQASLSKRLPLARLRRTARLGAFVALVSLLLLGFSLRTDLVAWFPQLAGLYGAIGLPVNVVGLEFSDAKTLTSLRNGKTVMQVSSRIRSVANRTVTVPPVLVSLLDAGGKPVYEWTVAPDAHDMDPGEILDFTTEVNSPPETAVTVRLSFTDPAGALAAPLTPKA